MSKGAPRPFAPVMRVAEFIAKELAPYSRRHVIVGSLRRRRKFVRDIDLLLDPVDRLGILRRLEVKCRVVSGRNLDAQNTIATLPDGLEINIFFARPPTEDLISPIPGNYGTLLLCRTGSKQHNIVICERALEMGLEYKPYLGLCRNGAIIASETEEEIYRLLNLPFLDPETGRDDITLDRLPSL